MYNFRGKRALVTGGGAGIGRGISLKLAELGADVMVIGRTSTDLLSLEEESPNIKTICLDITNWDKTRETVRHLAPIHLLVNNAGTGTNQPALEATPEVFDDTFNVNVKAMMNITQVVCKDLIERKEHGRVVNISSQASQRALNEHLIYCMTKASVDMMTKVFASELGAHNIRVNSVNPTVVMTKLGKKAWTDPSKAGPMLARIPQGRFAEIEEVVNAVLYLLSDQSEMINGHSLPVDGGFLAN